MLNNRLHVSTTYVKKGGWQYSVWTTNGSPAEGYLNDMCVASRGGYPSCRDAEQAGLDAAYEYDPSACALLADQYLI